MLKMWSCQVSPMQITLHQPLYPALCSVLSFPAFTITTWWATSDQMEKESYKVTFWLNWLLKQPTPQLTSTSYSTKTGTYCEGQQSRSAHAIAIGLHRKILFCILNLNHVHKQALKTHIQTAQQTHCFFGFGE